MPHIELPKGLPGIVGPMVAYPDTEKHLNGLADTLLRGPSSLAPGEREMIAAYVLIAAAFSMYTRYVDGLATWAPQEPAAYDEMGALIAENGYARTIRG